MSQRPPISSPNVLLSNKPASSSYQSLQRVPLSSLTQIPSVASMSREGRGRPPTKEVIASLEEGRREPDWARDALKAGGRTSLDLLIEWMGINDNYQRYVTPNGRRTKKSIAMGAAEYILTHGPRKKDADSVMQKIRPLQRSFQDAWKIALGTGEGCGPNRLKKAEEEAERTGDDGLVEHVWAEIEREKLHTCEYWDLLFPIMRFNQGGNPDLRTSSLDVRNTTIEAFNRRVADTQDTADDLEVLTQLDNAPESLEPDPGDMQPPATPVGRSEGFSVNPAPSVRPESQSLSSATRSSNTVSRQKNKRRAGGAEYEGLCELMQETEQRRHEARERQAELKERELDFLQASCLEDRADREREARRARKQERVTTCTRMAESILKYKPELDWATVWRDVTASYDAAMSNDDLL